MSYSKKMVSPSIDKNIIIFLADCKKVHKKERTGFFHAKLCLFFLFFVSLFFFSFFFVLVSKEKGTEKLILLYFLLIT